MNYPFIPSLFCVALTAYFSEADIIAQSSPISHPLHSAEWITVDSNHLPLFAEYLPVFRLSFDIDIKPGNKVSFIYGQDDPRLMNANLNTFQLANSPGESYMKIEVVTADSSCNIDTIKLYRAAYHPDDNPAVPVVAFPTEKLTHSGDKIELAVNLGHTDVFVNGDKVGYAGMNPIANGGDYIAFPVVGNLGVKISEGSKTDISNITLCNYREPSNALVSLPDIIERSCTLLLPQRSLPEMRSRVSLSSEKILKSATLYATARGIYDFYINGKRINDAYYLPGSTQYNRTHLYNIFDVTDYLQDGDNDLSVQLGEGWWSGGATFSGENWNFFGDRQALLAALEIEYADGTTAYFPTTPETWEYSIDGPMLSGSFFQGEVYDSRKINESSRHWHKAVKLDLENTVNTGIGNWDNIRLRPSFGDCVLPVDTLTAINMTEPRPGVYVYDLGQNLAGVPYITFKDLKPGQKVTLRHGEVLYPDMPLYADNIGMVMTENLRAAMCRDMYIASGADTEVFSPRFTLHGYRYLEITGIETPLSIESVKTIPVSSVHGFKAGFECSDSLVNRLWENIKWSTLSNFISLPTDCPQRNERLGWMGDISVFSPTATKIADVSALLEQYLCSVRDCQSAEGRFPDVAPTGFGFGGFLWGSAGIIVPWEHYRQYGDSAVLSDHYDAMKRYINFVFEKTIEDTTNIIVQDRAWGDLGDWLSPEYDKTDKSLLWECYLIYDLRIMRQVAELLGYNEDSAFYQLLAEQRQKHFIETYVDPITQQTRWSAFDSSKQGRPVDTQSSYALPLAMNIYDNDTFRKNFIASIERQNVADDGSVCPPYSLMTGFIGTAWIEEALSKIGRDDIAYRLLTSTTYPSWLYPVTQGATTVWERLNSYTNKDGFGSNNSMNSFNHYSFGSVAEWLITRCLGIYKDEDGKFSVNPFPDPTGRITYARGWLDTPMGRIESSWERLPDGSFKTTSNIEELSGTGSSITNK